MIRALFRQAASRPILSQERAPKIRRRDAGVDMPLLGVVLLLTFIGMVMMYSASAHWAQQNHGDALFFVKRQLVWLAIGLPAMFVVSKINYNRWGEWAWLGVAVSVIGLIGALLSPPIAGVRRWIRFGPVGLQPAEFAKLAMLVFLADYLDRKRSKIDSPVHGAAVPWSVLGLMLGLILLEKDLGTPALMFATAVLVLFIGGARLRYVGAAIAASLPLLVWQLWAYPYRRRRVLSFMNPFEQAQGDGYQLVQSILAVGSGGWFGKGLGASQLKLLHLPTPHTDFIFPVVCEELGLAGSLFILGLFVTLLLRGIKVARAAPNLFGTLLGSGIVLWIALQAFFNASMSVGLIPTKGVPLPFFSFGGSSLVVTLVAMGILLNISRQARPQ
ncbi:MAG: putative lipid II flippase FtsW [Elusimicrobia bacterium]|nr:putative lipid II flippase FtsW [Elusimicrobiota bacterium]